MDGQIASSTVGTTLDESVHTDYLWDGLALLKRGTTEYVNEPAVTGGNPILSNGNALFNDLLGTTLGSYDGKKFIGNQKTSFGNGSRDGFFTGKPYVEGLGYAFLFRNYRSNLGKWQTADPLGYPDGWNNLAYLNNNVIHDIDFLGAWSLSRWLYTGDGNASDEVYNAATSTAGDFIYDLNPVIQAGVTGTGCPVGGPSGSTQVNYNCVTSDISGATSARGELGYNMSANVYLGIEVLGDNTNGESTTFATSFSVRGPLGFDFSYDPTSGAVSFHISLGIGGGVSQGAGATFNYGNDPTATDRDNLLNEINTSMTNLTNNQVTTYITNNVVYE